MNLAIAALMLVAVSTWCGFVFTVLWGALTPWLAADALTIGAVAAVAAFWRCRYVAYQIRHVPLTDKIITAVFIFLCGRIFLQIYSYQKGFLYTLSSLWAKLPPHLDLMLRFAIGLPFSNTDPVLAGAVIQNFGTDFFTAIFMQLGMSQISLMPVMGITASVLLCAVLFLYSRTSATAGFLFLGGTAGIAIPVLSFLGVANYDMFREMAFYSILPFVQFFSERGLLFAFPLGILLLWSWRQKMIRNKSGLPAMIEAGLWGTLPLFHLPSFIILSSFFVLSAAINRKFQKVFPTMVGASVVALPILVILTQGFRTEIPIFKVLYGFPTQPDNAAFFAMRNFGYFIPWLATTIVGIAKSKRKREFFTVFFVAVIFGIALTVQFNPWKDAPNASLFAWCYIILLPLWHDYVFRLLKPAHRKIVLAALILPGIVVHANHFRWLDSQVPLANAAKIQEVCQSLTDFPRDQRFATDLEVNHPVVLCGYPVVSGYNDCRFILSSPAVAVSRNLRFVLSGDPNWQNLARELGIRFIYWGEREEINYANSTRPWEKIAPCVSQGPWGKIYDLGNRTAVAQCPAPGQGLRMRIYANGEWSGNPLIEERMRMVKLKWAEPVKTFLAQPWSAIFEGELFIPETGEIQFYLLSDDGSNLFINGIPIIDNLGVHGPRIASGKHYFAKGWYPIQVRYNDIAGGATLRLWWQLPSGMENDIPQENFRPYPQGHHEP